MAVAQLTDKMDPMYMARSDLKDTFFGQHVNEILYPYRYTKNIV